MATIQNITSLDELVKFDEMIREYTYRLCRDKHQDMVDDLVQDMYIKLHKAFEKGKTIDGGYIVITLKNLLINNLNIESRMDRGGEFYEVEFPKIIDDYNETLEIKQEQEEKYSKIEERIESLTWYEKKILQLQQSMSLLQLSKATKISYRSLIYTSDKMKNKLGVEPKKNKKK